MQEGEQHLTIEELAEQVDIPVRTIRYYISEDLLPGPRARGKAATYDEEHLLRLRLIRLLSQQRMPLAEMRARLTELSLSEVRTLLAEEEQRVEALQRAAQQPPPKEYIAMLLRNAQSARQPSVDSPYATGRQLRERLPELSSPVERWLRWQLAPGIELHIRSDAEEQHRSLLERIFRAAGMTYRRLSNYDK